MPPRPEAVIEAFALLEGAGYRLAAATTQADRARLFLTWTIAFIDLDDTAMLTAVRRFLLRGKKEAWPAPGNVRALLTEPAPSSHHRGPPTMSDALRTSVASGPHALLARLVGTWAGEADTYFEPGVLADRSPWRAEVRPLLGGRLVELAYASAIGGKALQGHALLGHHLQRGVFEVAWADTFHTGTQLMLATGIGPGGSLAVAGSYPAGDGPDWGWGIRLTLPRPDELELIMDNVPPGEPPAEAVVVRARRSAPPGLPT